MQYQYTPYVLLLLGSAAIAAALAASVWRHRSVPGATPFAAVAATGTFWSLANALEMAGVDLSTKLFWANVQYVSYVVMPVAWLALALQYTGRDRWLTRCRLPWLFAIPAITLTLLWTNDLHSLMRRDVSLDASGPFPVLGKTYGPWFWAHSVYSYLLVLLAIALLVEVVLRAPPFHRGQALALLAGLLLPVTWNILYVSGLSPIPRVDVSPVIFGLSGVVVVWGLVRFRLFDLVPVARDKVVEGLADGVITLDAEGRIVDLNPAAREVFDWQLPRMVGCDVGRAFEPWPELVEVCQGSGSTRTELALGTDGVCRHYDVHLSALDGWRGRPLGRVIVLHDITERKRVEEALRESERRYRELADSLPQPVFETDEKLHITFANRSAFDSFGYTQADFEAGLYVPQMIASWDLQRAGENIRRAMRGERFGGQEYDLVRKDGSVFPGAIYSSPITRGDRAVGLRGVIIDVTGHKRQEQQLAYLATHDPLTELPNRRSLEEALRQLLARARQGHPGTLLFLDVDNFKLVNDILGHAAGDEVLVRLTRLLQRKLRVEDLFARVGGDEFAVLLEGVDSEGALAVAERMRLAVSEFHFGLDGHSVNLGLSIGLVAVDGQCTPGVVLSQADAAMYRAKEQGRNRVVLYRPEEDDLARLSEVSRWAARLKAALRDDLFVLYYQPVVRLSDGCVEHYEALLRLREGTGEVISAGAFIHAAERFGLMPQLTRWVIQEVIDLLQARPGFRVFVNLSAPCVADEALPRFVETRLAESGLDPGRLGFEITETTMVQDLVAAERWVRRLRMLGCRFALDDFGAGSSSFAYLRNLPVDELKIDGSIISTLESDPVHRALVQAMQTLAFSLGKRIVAEFVENEAIANILRGIGVTHGQGYYLGRPTPYLPSDDPVAVGGQTPILLR